MIALKKTYGIFLLICLASPIFVSNIWFDFHRNEIRKEVRKHIREGLKQEEMICLTFTTEESKNLLDWEKEDEFEYRGQMYDVVRSETGRDSVHYWCIHDYKESRLKNRMKRLMADALGGDPQNRENRERLMTFMKTVYINNHYSWEPLNFGRDRKHRPYTDIFISSYCSDPLVPPPRCS